jgi:hypothetical protein
VAKRNLGIAQDLRLGCFISLEQDLTVTTYAKSAP